jgi:hypothetical protein
MHGGATIGPIEREELIRRIASGELPRTTLVRLEGSPQWTQAALVPGLLPRSGGAGAPGFRLAWPTWIVLVLAILVTVAHVVSAGVGGGDLPRGAGRIVGVLLFPLGLGWIAYRLGRRSHVAGNVVAGIVAALILFGAGVGLLLGTLGSGNESIDALNASADAMRDEARADIAQDGVYDGAGDAAEKFVAQAEATAAGASGPEKAVLEAGARALRRITDATKTYSDAVDAFTAAGGLDASTLSAPDAIDSRLALLDGMCREAKALEAIISGYRALFEEELVAAGVGSTGRAAAIRGLESTFKVEPLLEIRRLDNEFCVGARQMLDIYADNTWEYDASQQAVLFSEDTPDAVLDRFSSIGERLNEIGLRQQQLQLQNLK